MTLSRFNGQSILLRIGRCNHQIVNPLDTAFQKYRSEHFNVYPYSFHPPTSFSHIVQDQSSQLEEVYMRELTITHLERRKIEAWGLIILGGVILCLLCPNCVSVLIDVIER